MEEIFSASDTRHLPQAILDLKTVNGKDYASQGTSTPYIQFEIPASLGFVASEDITLNFDFLYTDTTGQVRKICPAEAQGIGGMLHQIDIYSIADGVLLESITDYETLNAVYVSSGVGSNKQVQSGQAKKMSIIESYVRDDEEVTPFWTPNADPHTTTSLISARNYQKQKVCLPLRYSALLGGSQVVPVGALGGLRVNIQCNPCALFTNVRKSDVLRESQLEFLPSSGAGFDISATVLTGTVTGPGGFTASVTTPASTVVKGPTEFLTFYNEQLALLATALSAAATAAGATYVNRIEGAIGTPTTLPWQIATQQFDAAGGGSTAVVLDLTGTFFSTFTDAATYALQAPSAGTPTPVNVDVTPASALPVRYFKAYLKNSVFGLNSQLDLNTCPFVVGQTLLYNVTGSNNNETPAITNISRESDQSTASPNTETHICLTFADLLPENVKTMVAGAGAWTSSNTFSGVEYSLTNVSLTCPVVSPPPSYTIAMTKAIQSGDGLNMNIRTWSLQRGNTLSGQAQSVILIPSVQTKVKGVVSVPFLATNGSFKEFDLADNVSNTRVSSYYYEYFGIRNPEQAVDTAKLSVGHRVPAELLWEQDKAFASCFDESLETYQGYDDRFRNRTWFLGRALSQFNGFMDARLANLQLVVSATSSAGSMNGNWSWDNHLSVIHTLNIKPEGVKLMI